MGLSGAPRCHTGYKRRAKTCAHVRCCHTQDRESSLPGLTLVQDPPTVVPASSLLLPLPVSSPFLPPLHFSTSPLLQPSSNLSTSTPPSPPLPTPNLSTSIAQNFHLHPPTYLPTPPVPFHPPLPFYNPSSSPSSSSSLFSYSPRKEWIPSLPHVLTASTCLLNCYSDW